MTKILAASMIFLLAGCATTLKDYKVSSLKPTDGTIVGNVKVVYNGNDFTEKCQVCFNAANGPCYKLDKTGLVVMKIKAGPTSIKRLACMDPSEQHYNMKGADFDVVAGTQNYFGDVTFDWVNAGGFKASILFGLVGAIVNEASNDGVLKMKVSSNPAGAKASYAKVAGQSDSAAVRPTIVKSIQ